MNIFKLFFKKNKIESKEESTLIENELHPEWDEVFYAWSSMDLTKMLKVVDIQTTLKNRHFLLQSIVSETYKRRDEEEYQNLCKKFSEIHLEEFKNIAESLRDKSDGSLPRVLTFQNYATLLTEIEEYEKAILVCELALSYNLNDGTKSNYHGRIERIKKKLNS